MHRGVQRPLHRAHPRVVARHYFTLFEQVLGTRQPLLAHYQLFLSLRFLFDCLLGRYEPLQLFNFAVDAVLDHGVQLATQVLRAEYGAQRHLLVVDGHELLEGAVAHGDWRIVVENVGINAQVVAQLQFDLEEGLLSTVLRQAR